MTAGWVRPSQSGVRWPKRGLSIVVALGLCQTAHLRRAAAQATVPLGPGTTLFTLDLAGTPVGEIPAAIKQTKGILEVVIKDGQPMLKVSAASEFVITLPQVLPQAFTVEFDLVPKACCIHPPDLIESVIAPINPDTMKAIGLVARPRECQATILTFKAFYRVGWK